MELEHHFEKIGTKIRCKKRTKHKGDNEKKPGFNEIELVTSQSDQKVFLILKSPGKEEKIELENMGFISLALSSPSIGFILNSEITNVEMESKKETEKLIRWFIGNIPEKQVCFECEKEEWSGKTEKIKVWIKFKNGELEVASPDPKTIIKGDIISFNFEKQEMSYGKGLTYITFRGESLPGGLLKYMADPTGELAAIEFWTMGSLGKVTASRVYPCLPLILLPMALMLCFGKQLLLLSQGSAQARQLGLAPGLWRGVLLGLATWMTAGVISVTGAIAFVGLIAPHIAFSLYRRRGGLYLLFCMAVGGELLLAADILARMLVPYAELPLSILTVAFSLPVLLLALRRRRKEAYGTDF